jgi:N-dimethylarginine dimethylaminohydrolase
MGTYILSYPGPGFSPRGSAASSKSRPAQLAFQQWLALCDKLLRAGARILVIDPSADLPPAAGLSDLVYAARIGAPFLSPSTGQPVFLRARGAQDGLPLDRDPVSLALRQAGIAVEAAQHRWQGQAEIVALPRNRFLLTYGPESDLASCDEVKRLLPLGAHVLCVEMAKSTGLSGLAHFVSKSGASVLLVDRSALRSHSPEDIGKFVIGGMTELFILGAEDVAIHATEGLCVRGLVLMPVGTSTTVRGNLVRRGFQVDDVDVSALFGPNGDGGGPRALCNEWPGFVLSDDSPSYATRRDELVALLEHYGGQSSS